MNTVRTIRELQLNCRLDFKMKKYFSAIIIFFVFNSCDTVLDNNPANNLKGMDIMRMTAEEENLINFFNNKFTD